MCCDFVLRLLTDFRRNCTHRHGGLIALCRSVRPRPTLFSVFVRTRARPRPIAGYLARVTAHDSPSETTAASADADHRVPTPPDTLPATLGELLASGWTSRSVVDELRANAIAKLRSGETLVPGVIGYDDTVLPQLINACLLYTSRCV